MSELKVIPEKIYLQAYDDPMAPEVAHFDIETTWCADRINPNDVEYRLGVAVDAEISRLTAQVAKLQAIAEAAREWWRCRGDIIDRPNNEHIEELEAAFANAEIELNVAVRTALTALAEGK